MYRYQVRTTMKQYISLKTLHIAHQQLLIICVFLSISLLVNSFKS